MITFDKIKLVTDIDYIHNIDDEKFETRHNDNDLTSMSFNMTFPYLLYIEIDYENSELVIEFSGKILGQDYPKLISKETIKRCLDNINDLGICTIRVEDIIADSEVVKCDVTKDIDFDDVANLTNYINANVRSHRQYNCRTMKNGNFVIEKNVTTKAYKKRLTIYNKGKEMNKSENRKFMSTYNYNGDEFAGKCRLEMNLNSKEQIRKSLGIADTQLMSVLSTTANPIADYLDEILSDDVSGWAPTSKKEYEAELVLRDCGFDIEAVEAKLKSIAGKSFRPSRDLKIYRTILSNSADTNGFTKARILSMVGGVSK